MLKNVFTLKNTFMYIYLSVYCFKFPTVNFLRCTSVTTFIQILLFPILWHSCSPCSIYKPSCKPLWPHFFLLFELVLCCVVYQGISPETKFSVRVCVCVLRCRLHREIHQLQANMSPLFYHEVNVSLGWKATKAINKRMLGPLCFTFPQKESIILQLLWKHTIGTDDSLLWVEKLTQKHKLWKSDLEIRFHFDGEVRGGRSSLSSNSWSYYLK